MHRHVGEGDILELSAEVLLEECPPTAPTRRRGSRRCHCHDRERDEDGRVEVTIMLEARDDGARCSFVAGEHDYFLLFSRPSTRSIDRRSCY